MRLLGRRATTGKESGLSKKLSIYNISAGDRNHPTFEPGEALPCTLPDLELPDLDLAAGYDLPEKAERVLGTGIAKRKSLGATSHRSSGTALAISIGADRDHQSHDNDDAASLTPIAEQKTLGSLWSTGSTHEHLLVDTMPGANGGLKPWPTVQQNVSMQDLLAAGMERPRMPAAPSTTDSRHYITRDKVSDSTLRSYYDSSRQPSNISQQTSDSAVRDMAWRRASPAVVASKSESELPRRPLKSALKHAPSPERERKPKAKVVTGSQPKKEGSKMLRLDFAHLLPRHNSAERLMTMPKHSFGSSTSVNAVPIPYAKGKPTKSSHVPKGALELEIARSVSAEPPSRPKVFETDVYDNTKVNVRRPPKGIQNWFDGFDISSDEEEQAPVELPASEALPSTFSPYQDTLKQRVPDHPSSNIHRHKEPADSPNARPAHTRRNPSDNLVNENLQAINQARQKISSRQHVQATPRARKNSADSGAPSAVSAQGRKTGGESRLANSRLAKESVLNLSDTSEDEQADAFRQSLAESFGYEAVVGNASPVNVRRPPGPPRKLEHNPARDTYMTTQTSGSIPITLDDEPPMPTTTKRDTLASIARHTEETLRQLTSPEPSTMPQRPLTQASNEGSAGGASASSFPSDASHMMAVTEEEMALLEMMRNKRAMMAKNSFTEGYRVALKREQEALVLRRQSAQKTALKILKHKEDQAREKHSSQIDDLGLGDEQRRRLSTLKQEDVDSRLKLRRFLSSETPLEGLFPSPPVRATPDDDAASLAQTEDLLLLPRTYTPQPQRQKSEASPLLPSPSTLGGSEEGSQLQADLSRFLASGGRAESVAFPLPPKSTTTKEQRRKSQRSNGILSPSLSTTEEESFAPPIPSRSPNRLTSFNEHTPSPQVSDSTTSHHDRNRGDSTVLSPSQISTITTSSPPPVLPQAPTPRAAKKGDHYASILSPYLDPNISLLDFPFPASNSGASASQPSRNDSPSISTSRASPMTPTFTPAALNISQAQAHNHNLLVEIANSDSVSPSARYASSDQSSLQAPTRHREPKLQPLPYQHHAQPPSMHSAGNRKKSPSPLLSLDRERGRDNAFGHGHTARGNSVSSVSSAAGDVLAAWADLGGGSEGLVVRSRGYKQGRGY